LRLLFDTHVVVSAARNELSKTDLAIFSRRAPEGSDGFFSVASLWEIAIKTRLGKLDPGMDLSRLPDFLDRVGVTILEIGLRHVLSSVQPEPATRDPFDRLLLAQCELENMRLVTNDRALRDHPLAFQPA
jgi:PIN domain nuclease of toxin-antitoxin system